MYSFIGLFLASGLNECFSCFLLPYIQWLIIVASLSCGISLVVKFWIVASFKWSNFELWFLVDWLLDDFSKIEFLLE
jgi:hypothetical protein